MKFHIFQVYTFIIYRVCQMRYFIFEYNLFFFYIPYLGFLSYSVPIVYIKKATISHFYM